MAPVMLVPPVSTSAVSCADELRITLQAYSNRFDRVHYRVSGWVEVTAENLDEFLTDVITADDNPAIMATNTVGPLAETGSPTNIAPSYVTVCPGITYSKEDGIQYRGRFKAHINLPSLKNRVQVIVNNVQDDEDVLGEVTDPISRERRVAGENDKSAGLRVMLIDRMDFDLSASAGLRFKPAPVTKLKTRARVGTVARETLYELAETGFWESDNGFGEKTEFIMTRALGSRFVLRNTGAALLQEKQDGVTLGETLSADYLIRPRMTAGVTFGVEWYTEPAAAVNNYSLRFPYRQGIWRDWMYLRIEPGADWSNDDDFKINPLITIGFDIQFGVVPERTH